MSRTRRREKRPSNRKVRYAVVGLGWFAQTAVLPAFAHAAPDVVGAEAPSGN